MIISCSEDTTVIWNDCLFNNYIYESISINLGHNYAALKQLRYIETIALNSFPKCLLAAFHLMMQ